MKLKLVASNGKVSHINGKTYSKRPLIVHYSGGHVGHCSTMQSAIVAATRWLLQDAAKHAEIVSPLGVPLARLERTKRAISIVITLAGSKAK